MMKQNNVVGQKSVLKYCFETDYLFKPHSHLVCSLYPVAVDLVLAADAVFDSFPP
ncbi:MAG: hypothetical protein PVJ11_08100 [Syntrophobacterales bacterium]